MCFDSSLSSIGIHNFNCTSCNSVISCSSSFYRRSRVRYPLDPLNLQI